MPSPISALTDLVLPALSARFVLLANHVLASAPVAPEKLKPHSGRVLRIEVTGWRGPLPPPPPLSLRITPAGLFEEVITEPMAQDTGADADVSETVLTPAASVEPDLRLTLDASQPVANVRRLASGALPSVQIEGDAALAADVSWVVSNVRWDIAHDLERLMGTTVVESFSRTGAQVMDFARQAVQSATSALRPKS
jgi:ubiquinone biosynthesis accessory factor UbiJ